jgi:transposase InsO family protein
LWTFTYVLLPVSVLDGYSRYIANWDLRESMNEADIEIMLQRAKELNCTRNGGCGRASQLRQAGV